MIALIDYKAGNLASVKKAFDAVGAESVITSEPAVVRASGRLVLPGVGHFAATRALDDLGLRTPIEEAIAMGKPFFGICVGMQWLYRSSAEAPDVAGLGAVDAVLERFPAGGKCPHVGWNSVKSIHPSRLLHGIADDAFVYFAHSYRAPLTSECVARTEYGGEFAAVVERENIFGTQFHPEKSGTAGLQIIRNFVELAC